MMWNNILKQQNLFSKFPLDLFSTNSKFDKFKHNYSIFVIFLNDDTINNIKSSNLIFNMIKMC